MNNNKGFTLMSKALRGNRSGFTLIELLLYIAIVSVVVFIISNLLFSVLQSRVKNQTVADVEQEGAFVMRMITQTVRNGTAINSPAIGASSASLSVNVTSAPLSPTIFDSSGGVIRITEGAGAPVNLTSSHVTVSALLFQNLSVAALPQGSIRISYTITHVNTVGRNEYSYSKTFTGTADLRQ